MHVLKRLGTVVCLVGIITCMAEASPLACGTDSFFNYTTLGATGCIIGDKIFSNFALSSYNPNGNPPPDIGSLINSLSVTPFSTTTDAGFSLSGGLLSSAPVLDFDFIIVFTVTTDGGQMIDTATTALTPATTPPNGGTATVTGNVMEGINTVSKPIASLSQLSDSQPVSPMASSVHVLEEVIFTSRDPISLTSVTIDFNSATTPPTPEPAATMLIGTGLLSLAFLARRRSRARA